MRELQHLRAKFDLASFDEELEYIERLEQLKVKSAIIFVGTVKKCRLLDHLLDEMDVKALCMHSKLPMKKRLQALERFKSGLAPILLATDVAAA